jgi:hypothetical protein
MIQPRPVGHPDEMSGMPTIASLDGLVHLAETDRRDLFVRWSRGPDVDLRNGQSSRDGLTGARMPGLSANPLRVESWWTGSLRLWLARRLHDYRHLADLRGPGVRPWVLAGVEIERGPDNEPLVECHAPVAWIARRLIDEAELTVNAEQSAEWGPLDRR